MNSQRIENAPADIARLSSQLAKNNARVSSFIDGLPGSVDELTAAIGAADWAQVRRVSDGLADAADSSGDAALSETARQLSESAGEGEDPQQIKRRAIKLIGACGRARPPQ